MTVNFVMGFSADITTAKERALYFYNEIEGRKSIVFIESQIGVNELGDKAWFTTIWYNLADPTPEQKREQEEQFYYIGSTDVDPNDPNWREKLYDQETADTDWRLNTDDYGTDAVQVHAVPTVDLEVIRSGI